MAWNPTVTETQFATEVTAHAANLPATVNAGDLLIAQFVWPKASVTLSSGPGGFWVEKLAPTTQGAGNAAATLTIYALDAAGSEDGGTATFTTSAGVRGAAQVMRIPAAEWSGTLTDFELGTPATGIATNPDPPGVTASWGSDDNLFITFLAAADDDETVVAYSTNYTGVDTISGGGTGTPEGATAVVQWRALTAASDDPDALELTGSENVVNVTGVVKPAAVVAFIGRGSRLSHKRGLIV